MYSTLDLQKLVQMLNYLGIASSAPAHSVMLGGGAYAATSTAGKVLASNGPTADPSFQSIASLGIAATYIPTLTGADMTGVADGSTVIAQGRDTVGDGGGGTFRYSATGAQTVDGGTVFQPATGGGRLLRDGWTVFGYNGVANAAWFGVKMDNATNNNAALALCATFLSEFAWVQELHFGPGVCVYDTSPNWGIQNAVIIGHGECHLKYTGTGYAVIANGIALPNLGAFNVTMRGFTIDSNAGALDGAFISYCQHGTFKLKVRGAGNGYAGIKVSFCVLTHFDNCEVSPNSTGSWLAQPLYGVHVTGPSPTLQTSYCVFTNLICEGLTQTNGAGIFINAALGNSFIGGTAENCYTGILTASPAAGCVSNKFFGVDMESNVQQDIYEQGFQNEYWSCDTNLLVNVISGSLRAQFFGGQHQSISIAAGASYPAFTNCVYNRNGSGTFVDGSNTARIRDCFDHHNNVPGPFGQSVLSVGVSPWTYTNTKGRDTQLAVSVSGGTVSQVQLTRGGIGTLTSQLGGLFPVSPNDQYTFTYTGTLSVTEYTK